MPELLDAAEVVEPIALELLVGRKRVHGTATSFPPVELSLEEVEDWEVVDDGGVDGVVELVKVPDELAEITAKSILPEDGFNTRSEMVPTVWP
jgi:hypothetical protein